MKGPRAPRRAGRGGTTPARSGSETCRKAPEWVAEVCSAKYGPRSLVRLPPRSDWTRPGSFSFGCAPDQAEVLDNETLARAVRTPCYLPDRALVGRTRSGANIRSRQIAYRASTSHAHFRRVRVTSDPTFSERAGSGRANRLRMACLVRPVRRFPRTRRDPPRHTSREHESPRGCSRSLRS